MEVLNLLHDLHPIAPPGGPLSEEGGLFWILLPTASIEKARTRLPRLGYTYAVDLLEPLEEDGYKPSQGEKTVDRLVRWRHKMYRLVHLYEEDREVTRTNAPDQREFLFETKSGELRSIRGYRGSSSPLSRRGLPVYDARLLVNLVWAGEGSYLLDPFAGAGGIVIEAITSGCKVTSVDIDPALQYGLSQFGANHYVADARHLPFPSGIFDAIATEPPYHEEAKAVVVEALGEMYRVLRPEGRLAILCAALQADDIAQAGDSLGLRPYLHSPIDRKGLDVVVFAWQKE
jgi:hypothetical protein